LPLLVAKDEHIKDAKVAYLKAAEEQGLLPKRRSIVQRKGIEQEIDA
jgi:hypothetical protein